MADTFQTIIDTGVRPDDADHLARHVVAFLAERGVIAANPSEEGGYARGPRALEIAEATDSRPAHEAIPPSYSHLQIIIGRATHSNDMSEARAPKADCPECGAMYPDDDPDESWEAACQAWLAGDDDSYLACPICQVGGPVASWKYGSAFAFGNLAFRFWNWPPFRESFLREIRSELGHPVAIVRGKL
ncbi:MAG TPA: hypothetical protein VNM14_19640 [Planctomycetota bacterium]|jgi:hypothetical protein|nr:hypothetical protein [Planctomycetota bacterium]